jgi:hypothetical protein
MAVIDDTVKEVIDGNKQRIYEKNKMIGKVKRIELGEVMYQFEEIFNSPQEAYEKDKQGDNPKFIVLEKKVQQVNIKPISEANIERGKDEDQSEKDIANTKSATTGKPTNE